MSLRVVVLVLDTVVVAQAVSVLEQDFRLQPERITRLPLAVAVLLLQLLLRISKETTAAIQYLAPLRQQAVVAVVDLTPIKMD